MQMLISIEILITSDNSNLLGGTQTIIEIYLSVKIIINIGTLLTVP